MNIIKNNKNEDEKNDSKIIQKKYTNTFGNWLSQICYERSKLTKQQEIIINYLNLNFETINNIYDISEWELRQLSNKMCIDPTIIMEKLYIYHKIENKKVDSKRKLIEIIKKILYDLRTENINKMILKCNHKCIVNDEYFLNDIVMSDVKLQKFLTYNLGFEPTNEIPTLITKIRTYLKELNALKIEEKEEKRNVRAQTIYGNKIGRWIGEIIHDRLSYLHLSKTIHDFIIISHWDSGILPHIGKKMFINKIKKHLLSNNIFEMESNDKLLSDIWIRLERVYVNNPNAFHATHSQVAQIVFEYIQEIRRANIYQIAVECINDIQCIDAKTFYTKIGSNKNILRKFINKILKRTNQLNRIIMDKGIEKQLIVEKIYFYLSIDILDNNILFENWLSDLIYDPITLWLNTMQINNFLIKENISNIRAQTWKKEKFIQKAKIQCNSLNMKQSKQLFEIAIHGNNAKDIFQSISNQLKEENKNKKEEILTFIEDKNINKLSFLNVTAINVKKLIEFIECDLGIKHNKENGIFVNNIIEKLRLCLKIHTDLFDDMFNDQLSDANILLQFIINDNNEDTKEEEEEEKKEEIKQEQKDAKSGSYEWVIPNMIELTEFDSHQLTFALCYKLIQNQQFEDETDKIYNNIKRLKTKINGNFFCEYIVFAQKQFDINKSNENNMIEQQMEKQKEMPWKYKHNINELEANEISEMAKECLLNDSISIYTNKMNNISQKIMDTNMNGKTFIQNLNISKNVFIHRMMDCFGENYSKSNHKFIENIYNDLKPAENDDLNNIKIADLADIDNYNTKQLSNYLKTYQIKKLQAMIIEFNINGKAFNKYKRHKFATEIKNECGISIGIGTMLYKKLKTYRFVPAVSNKSIIINSNNNPLKNNPCIEFISLITKTFNINHELLCIEIWNDLLQKFNENELQKMNENDIMKYIYGFQVNSIYFDMLEKINKKNENEKYKIIQTLIQKKFKWLNNAETLILLFEHTFIEYIAEYFKSQLLLIIIYQKKYKLLTEDGIKYLLKLDHFNITLNKLNQLNNIKDNEIDRIMSQYKKGYNKNTVNGIIKQIKIFIQKDRKLQQKTNLESWACDDIGLYVMKTLCLQMEQNVHNNNNNNNNNVCILDILICIKYVFIFIEDIIKDSVNNNMKELINRKSKNKSLYEIDNDMIPCIVSDIFVSWIKEKVPNQSNNQNKAGFFSKIFS